LLFNLDQDVGERTNRFAEQSALAAELTALHREWIATVGNR
jgi:hypothetical protein